MPRTLARRAHDKAHYLLCREALLRDESRARDELEGISMASPAPPDAPPGRWAWRTGLSPRGALLDWLDRNEAVARELTRLRQELVPLLQEYNPILALYLVRVCLEAGPGDVYIDAQGELRHKERCQRWRAAVESMGREDRDLWRLLTRAWEFVAVCWLPARDVEEGLAGVTGKAVTWLRERGAALGGSRLRSDASAGQLGERGL